MTLLLLLCLTVPPFLAGMAVLKVLRENRTSEFYVVDAAITGGIVCIGTAEAAHLAAFFLRRPFSDAVRLFAIFMGLLLAASLVILLWGNGRPGRAAARSGKPYSVFEVGLFLAFALFVVYQIVQITVLGKVYIEGDMTVETVDSFLKTDAFYQINPMTGRAYEAGVPSRLKILCLSTIYGSLCKWFGVPATEVVWQTVPVVTLIGSYLVFYVLARCFFPEKDDRARREIFMLLVAALLCVGDYRYGMDGMGLLHSGFRGVTIRNAVLIPYTVGLMLRAKPRRVILCVLAEACIVWTLYGLGACLLTALLMAAVRQIRKCFDRKTAGSGEGV